jgi:hypothetical protein
MFLFYWLCPYFLRQIDLSNIEDYLSLKLRVQSLTPDTKTYFCTMTVQELLPHLADAIRVGIGDKPAERSWLYWIFSWPILRGFFAFWAPWPYGIPAPPEFKASEKGTKPGAFEEDLKQLLTLMKRMNLLIEGANLPEHPVFGRLTTREWKKLMARHIDHHLIQCLV